MRGPLALTPRTWHRRIQPAADGQCLRAGVHLVMVKKLLPRITQVYTRRYDIVSHQIYSWETITRAGAILFYKCPSHTLHFVPRRFHMEPILPPLRVRCGNKGSSRQNPARNPWRLGYSENYTASMSNPI